MKTQKLASIYAKANDNATWKLLAAPNAPAIIAMLQSQLWDEERCLPTSVLHEKIERDLEDLRLHDFELNQTAQAYISGWVKAGLLERRYMERANEEEYELSSAAVAAIRFAQELVDKRKSATESRLAVVIQQILKLAEETDPNTHTRMEKLLSERSRIDNEIEELEEGSFEPLEEFRALERIKEIISLSSDLIADFRSVREEFADLNQDLRAKIVNNDSSRGAVLADVFDGVDLIGESSPGKTFSSFWKLLTDAEQSANLDHAIEQLGTRSFWQQLSRTEKRFVLFLTKQLLSQGEAVHEVMQVFARSLRNFVQSKEYLEHRLLGETILETQKAALAVKDVINPITVLNYQLELTSCRFRSPSQFRLYDPSAAIVDGSVKEAGISTISLELVKTLVDESEIDFEELKANILHILQDRPTAFISDVLNLFPATQGLASIVGYIALGAKFGVIIKDRSEIVSWSDGDCDCVARIPGIYFLKERTNEF